MNYLRHKSQLDGIFFKFQKYVVENHFYETKKFVVGFFQGNDPGIDSNVSRRKAYFAGAFT